MGCELSHQEMVNSNIKSVLSMALYLLSYDLRKEGRDYQKLYDELKSFNAVRILESVWCFKRNYTSCVALRNHFKRFIDSNDGIIVTEVHDWATYNTDDTPNSLN